MQQQYQSNKIINPSIVLFDFFFLPILIFQVF